MPKWSHMDKEVVKEQLLDYNRQFKRKMGNFKSFEIVFDYINFLASEPYTVKVLTTLVDYIEKQGEILGDKDLTNISLDLSKPDSLAKMPIFKREFKAWQEDLINKKEPQIMSGLPIYFTLLIEIATIIQSIKDSQKAGDIEEAKRLIEEVKDKSLSVVDLSMLKGTEIKKITYGQYIDVAMELVNKFIIDDLDAQALLDNEKPQAQISFDKEKSVLYYRGKPIKIAKQKRPPLEHYILECIFSKDDISDPADFSEIYRDFFKEDYNEDKKWTFRSACDNLNEKVRIGTNSVVDKFIIYSTEKLGWCKIDKKYL